MTAVATARTLSALDIVMKSLELLRFSWQRALFAVVLMIAPGFVTSAATNDEIGIYAADLLALLLAVVLSYWVFRTLLRDLGYRLPPHRLPGFLVLNLVCGVAILAGLVLFVVPGIVLWVRWLIAGPLLVGSQSTVVQSLGDSWRETGPHFWAILLVQFALNAPWVALGFLDLPSPTGSLVVMLFVELASSAAWVMSWIVGVAIVALLMPVTHWEDVFG